MWPLAMLRPALNHRINCALEPPPSIRDDFKIIFSFAG